jgi:hypothetical protein
MEIVAETQLPEFKYINPKYLTRNQGKRRSFKVSIAQILDAAAADFRKIWKYPPPEINKLLDTSGKRLGYVRESIKINGGNSKKCIDKTQFSYSCGYCQTMLGGAELHSDVPLPIADAVEEVWGVSAAWITHGVIPSDGASPTSTQVVETSSSTPNWDKAKASLTPEPEKQSLTVSKKFEVGDYKIETKSHYKPAKKIERPSEEEVSKAKQGILVGYPAGALKEKRRALLEKEAAPSIYIDMTVDFRARGKLMIPGQVSIGVNPYQYDATREDITTYLREFGDQTNFDLAANLPYEIARGLKEALDLSGQWVILQFTGAGKEKGLTTHYYIGGELPIELREVFHRLLAMKPCQPT